MFNLTPSSTSIKFTILIIKPKLETPSSNGIILKRIKFDRCFPLEGEIKGAGKCQVALECSITAYGES
jgi:hypothetical protein